MRSNNDFKKLVMDKHKVMISERKMKRKKFFTAASCLLICFTICTVIINSGFFEKNHLAADSITQSQTGNSQNRDCSEEHGNGSHNSTLGTIGDADINSDSYGESSGSISQGTVSSSVSDGNDESSKSELKEDSGIECPDDSNTTTTTPPIAQITFIPDDYPIITGTVNLMSAFYSYAEGNESCEPNAPDSSDNETDAKKGLADFSFNLFRNIYKSGENNVISPASLFYSLAMVSNGALGNTKTELDNILCGGDSSGLNEYLLIYRRQFGNRENCTASIDSAIWYADDITVNKCFLQTNYDYYGADAYKTIMSNDEALNSINAWIDNHTNGLIKEMIKEVDPETSMILANTVYFEASWRNQLSLLTQKQLFTSANGTETYVEMMRGSTDQYIENEYCTGFINKYYGNFSFVALLPNEGMTTADVINSLNSASFYGSDYKAEKIQTDFIMPKFECTSELSLIDSLKAMGINDAFNENADFSAMIKNPGVMISKVNQNVTISVNENGTLAAAATVVEAMPESPSENESESKFIVLNRPFVYMIYDNSTKLPVFIGTVENF